MMEEEREWEWCKNTRCGNFAQDTEEEEARRRGEARDGVRGHERDTLVHV